MCVALNRDDPGLAPVPEAHTRATLLALRTDPVRGRAVILELEGKTAGYAFLISYWSNELGGEICSIDEIYLKKEFRGRGHGRAFILNLMSSDSIWPGKPVSFELEVSPNNTKARTLYEDLGFRPIRNSRLRFVVPPS